MKVKELLKKYPNYSVVYMGYPHSIPFTGLPKELQDLTGKRFEVLVNELDVKGYDVKNEPHEDIDITHIVLGGKKRPNKKYDGYLKIYLKGEK